MTEEKHTAGEWRIEGRRGPGYIISAGVNAEGDGPAAYVGVLDPMFYVAGSPSDLEANARLIASAPDGLALARAVLEHFVSYADVGASLNPGERALLDKAELLVSRATGAA